MAPELRDRLQSSLGSAYTIDRELGGGGMSRVFLSQETSLGRRVVVKVLPPDLAAGVSVERFKREIQLAAGLQHAHIVPVLAAGESDGLPYFTMPYVEGDSLRARLAAGPLPLGEAVSVLRDVARALAYAHERGVVHRDVKPDNVLLAGGAAVVTDFGIAKAIAAARGSAGAEHANGALTGIGTSLGTPAYMAPEQAAADPAADHRVDIYAFGCMAYELLAGRAPFAGMPPARMLAAQMSQRPEPVRALRLDCPPALADLVMRCLEKEPHARPQTAAEVLQALDAAASSGGHAAAPVIALASRRTLLRALAIYGAAFLGVALLAKVAIVAVGLPDWVLPAALVVMALGLPAILLTALVHHQSRLAHTVPTLTPGGSRNGAATMATLAVKASPHVTWRRTALGGVLAVGALALFTGGYMLLRALGIGPAGSLMAAGVLGERERVIVADFRSPAADTTLGPVVAEAFRTDLAQSRNLTVFQPAAVRDVLRRMRRPVDVRVDFALAREVASREGLKAVVDGDVVALGGGYVLSARLVAAQTGEELALVRETAEGAADMIPAIGRLSKQLRAKVGESLRTVQRTAPLERVSTGSLEALRKYVQGSRAVGAGDFERGKRLLEEAITLDTTFAMAYRRLGVELGNQGGQTARQFELLQKAYDHRDRLSEVERHLTIGSYFWTGPQPDADRAIEAFEAAIQLDSLTTTAWNNAGALYRSKRDFARAERYLQRVVRYQGSTGMPVTAVAYGNLAGVQTTLGRPDEAARTIELLARAIPTSPTVAGGRASVAYLRGRPDSAETIVRSMLEGSPSGTTREAATSALSALAQRRGRLREAIEWSRQNRQARLQRGVRGAAVAGEIAEALDGVWFLDRKAEAVRAADGVLARRALDSLPAIERPYATLVRLYAFAGRPDRARQMLAAYDAARERERTFGGEITRRGLEGDIAVAERRYGDALAAYRASDEGACTICALPNIARAYDLAGNADSAVAVFERFISTPHFGRQSVDAAFLAGAHKRLGELYEARGNRAKAAHHYAAFVDLWKDADPELQPRVREARERLARLQRAERP